MRRVIVRLAFGLILFHLMLIFAAFAVAHAQPPRSWITWTMGDYGERMDIYLWDGSTVLNFTRNFPSPYNTAPAWSYDGELAWIANLDGDDDVFVWDGERIRDVSQSDENESRLLWSPTGQLAWVVEIDLESYLRVWDRRAGIVMDAPMGSSSNPFGGFHQWSSQGQLAWVRSVSHLFTDIMVWDGGQVINLTQTPRSRDCNPQWSQEGQLMWMSDCQNSSGSTNLSVWDGETIHLIAAGYINRAAWSHDGRLAWDAAYLGTDGSPAFHELYIWDGGNTTKIGEYLFTIPTFQWSNNGNFITWWALSENDLVIKVWNGEQTIVLPDVHGTSPFWIDDQRFIYTMQRQSPDDPMVLSLWDGTTSLQLSNPIKNARNGALMPDGRVAWVEDDQLVIWHDGRYSYLEGEHFYVVFSPPFP